MQVSILTYEQVYLDKKLEIFYSEKLEAKPTDLALILASKSLGFNEEMAFYIKPYHLSLKAIYSVDPTRMGVYNEDVNGVKTGDYSITETEAPKGYNKLTAPVTVTATKTGETRTSTITYLDADGKIAAKETTGGSTVLVTIEELAATSIVVVNQTGAELPSTGGMGTTIFYALGAALAIGAGIILVTRKRLSK